jgi:hypothetical protein
MSAESKAGLGVLLAAALLIVMLVDTFPQTYRRGLLAALCVLACAGWVWLCL